MIPFMPALRPDVFHRAHRIHGECWQLRQCPLSEVRTTLQQSPSTNFVKPWARVNYDSSAAFRFEVPGFISPLAVQGLQIGGTSAHFPKFVHHFSNHLLRTSESHGH